MNKMRLALGLLSALSLPVVGLGYRTGDRPGPKPVTALDAQAFLRQGDWARAAAAYEQVLRTLPDDGQAWNNYGFALHALKRYDEAIKAATRAAELGFRPATSLYNIACAHALLGHKEDALAALEKSLDAGFPNDGMLRTDTDLDALRAEPRFKKLLGLPPDNLSRDERWRHDLDYLVRRMEKVHYNLYAKVSRDKFRAAVDGLKGRIGGLTNEEIAVGVQRILAQVGDGHTTLAWQHGGDHAAPRYPVDLYLFKEGLFVRGAKPALAEIVGAKVVRLGKAGAEEALEAVAPLCARDNTMGVKLHAPRYLTNPAVISYFHLADDPARVPLVVRKPGGEEVTVELKPVVVPPSEEAGFVRANAGAAAPEPLSFKKNHDRYWFQHLPERKLIYFQYNEVGNKQDEPLEKFCNRLFKFIEDNPVEYLVIDLRNNGGGNNALNRPLVHGLIRSDKVNRPGHLFVLVGRHTFSAAMNGAVDIERNAAAIFVGEPTGSSPNHVGEGNLLVLPCSGLRLTCSSLYWQSSTPTDSRAWIAPSLLAEPSITAFAANRDPGLEAIFASIDDRLGAGAKEKGREPSPAKLESRVDAYISPYLASHDFSGVLLIARGDQVLLRKAYGMANYELSVPNTPDTKFQIASLTKTFTAAALAMLQEQGRLSFNDPLSKFLPDFPRADKITLLHLLSHTSGVANPDYGSIFNTRLTPDELIATFRDKPFQFEPGTSDQYSNAGFILLARVVEKVSGRSYGDFLREHLFSPLGMADTGYFDTASIVPNRASGYTPGPGPLGLDNAPSQDSSTLLGSGCITSTANDLLKWARAVRTERLFKRTALKYPFGWGARNQYGHRYIEQSGIVTGFTSHLVVFLDEPVDVICLSNVQSGLFGRLEKDLIALAFDGQPDKSVPPPPKAITLQGRLLRGSVGLFQGPGNFRVRILEDGGHLYSKYDDGPARAYLVPVSENELFMRTEFARVRLTRDGAGRATELSITWGWGGEPTKLTRVDPGARGTKPGKQEPVQ